MEGMNNDENEEYLTFCAFLCLKVMYCFCLLWELGFADDDQWLLELRFSCVANGSFDHHGLDVGCVTEETARHERPGRVFGTVDAERERLTVAVDASRDPPGILDLSLIHI
eukprot:TRINITY_DN11683_c0_g1_i1.p1 TRINITY_DN11683_c0_g1~~TRINITY_DN11683_c0_g1_i1.p1  ORF type:complete len:111 (+),score=9.49 TRINITY_DN11683_c0_g1_i1:91-423(+)